MNGFLDFELDGLEIDLEVWQTVRQDQELRCCCYCGRKKIGDTLDLGKIGKTIPTLTHITAHTTHSKPSSIINHSWLPEGHFWNTSKKHTGTYCCSGKKKTGVCARVFHFFFVLHLKTWKLRTSNFCRYFHVLVCVLLTRASKQPTKFVTSLFTFC